MSELIERLKNEADELSEKYVKLGMFTDSKKLLTLLNIIDYMEEQLKEKGDE